MRIIQKKIFLSFLELKKNMVFGRLKILSKKNPQIRPLKKLKKCSRKKMLFFFFNKLKNFIPERELRNENRRWSDCFYLCFIFALGNLY